MASASTSSHPMTTVAGNLPSATRLAIPAPPGAAASRAESPLSDLPSDTGAAVPLSRRNDDLLNGEDTDSAAPVSLPPHANRLEPEPAAPMSRTRRVRAVKMSPAKGRSLVLGRRAAATAAAGNIANTGKNAGLAPVDEGPIANNDFCDACDGKGHFLCCDGCPRSFHFSCLDPPLELDMMTDDQWFCTVCQAAKNPPQPNRGLFAPLIDKVVKENPTMFELPKEIRNAFKTVTTDPYGGYMDTDEFRPLSGLGKAGRGGYEERDPYKLRDKSGRMVFCRRCHEPANPLRRRRILACDFCELYWHLDCVDPPLVGMPPPVRKWRCPLHADGAIKPDKKFKHQKIVRVKQAGLKNNGDIEIIPTEGRLNTIRHVPEEMTRQGMRYQVPEQIVIFDFWSKVKRDRYGQPLNRKKPTLADFDLSDSSLTSIEGSPERDLAPSFRDAPQAEPSSAADLDRHASRSQQSMPHSAREDTAISDGDPPFMDWSAMDSLVDAAREAETPTTAVLPDTPMQSNADASMQAISDTPMEVAPETTQQPPDGRFLEILASEGIKQEREAQQTPQPVETATPVPTAKPVEPPQTIQLAKAEETPKPQEPPKSEQEPRPEPDRKVSAGGRGSRLWTKQPRSPNPLSIPTPRSSNIEPKPAPPAAKYRPPPVKMPISSSSIMASARRAYGQSRANYLSSPASSSPASPATSARVSPNAAPSPQVPDTASTAAFMTAREEPPTPSLERTSSTPGANGHAEPKEAEADVVMSAEPPVP